MSLSISTLSAIQKVGAAAFVAHSKLNNAVKEYAARTHTAMESSQDHGATDAAFTEWKVVSQLAQAMAGIEEDLKKLHESAQKLTSEAMPAAVEIPAPVTVVKGKKTSAKLKKRVAALPATPVESSESNQSALPAKVDAEKNKKKATILIGKKRPKATGAQLELTGNAAKLMQYFEKSLNPNDFVEIQQSVVSKEIGIPLGSMTASIKKLTELGRIIVGQKGSLKLPTVK